MKHRNPLSWYNVLSPSYIYIEVVTDDGQGPLTVENDWLCVQAYTKADAKARAVKHWIAHQAGYIHALGGNPYKGVTVERCQPAEAQYADEWRSSDCYLPYDV